MEKAKPSGLKLPARAGLWGIISSILARGVGVLGTPIFTRLLLPEEYGIYPLYTTYLSLAEALVVTSLSGSLIYRGLERHKDDADGYIAGAVGLSLTLTGVLFILGLFLSGVMYSLTGLEARFYLVLALEVGASAVIGIRSARCRFEYDYKTLAFLNLVVAFGSPMISVLLIKLAGLGGEGRIYGSSLIVLLVALPLLYDTTRRGRGLIKPDIMREISLEAIRLIPHYLASSLILRSGSMVIGAIYGTDAVGKYSVALSLGLGINVVSGALTGALSPWVTRKLAKGDKRAVSRLNYECFLGIMLIALLFLSAAPELMLILAPEGYVEALSAVYPLALSVGVVFLSNMALTGEVYLGGGGRGSVATLISSGVAVGLSLLILPRAHYTLAGVISLIAYILSAQLQSWNYYRLSGEWLFDIKRAAVIFSVSILYAILLYLLRGVLVSRVLLALPLLPPLLVLGLRVLREAKEGGQGYALQ